MVYNKHKGRVRQILTKMNRKLITKILGASLVLVLTLVIAGSALANENENESSNSVRSKAKEASQSKTGGTLGWGEMKKLSDYDKEENRRGEAAVVKANGDFRVNGVTANSVNASSSLINVTFFGITRDVNVSGVKIMGGGRALSLSDVQAGDKLNAAGNYNATTKVITVYEIQDVTSRTQNISEIQKRIQQLMDMINALKAKLGIQ